MFMSTEQFREDKNLWPMRKNKTISQKDVICLLVNKKQRKSQKSHIV